MKKRIISFLVIVCMFFATTTAYATGNTERTNYAVKSSATTYVNDLVSGTVNPNKTINLYVPLANYIGFKKTLNVHAVSDSTSGALLLMLYDPKGELKSHDWVMGVNDACNVTLTLPYSGMWRLQISAQGNNAPVYISAKWDG